MLSYLADETEDLTLVGAALRAARACGAVSQGHRQVVGSS